jgi:hypothetical protein
MNDSLLTAGLDTFPVSTAEVCADSLRTAAPAGIRSVPAASEKARRPVISFLN